MPSVHDARFWEPLDGGKVLCTLCPHDCKIGPGGRGACVVRYNEGGKLYTLVYDKVISRGLDPIEKKPLFHFFPGSTAYSIATVGCNLRCAFCQEGRRGRHGPGSRREGRRMSPPDRPGGASLARSARAIR